MSNTFPRMHVSLYVSDINKTVAFYEAFFGQQADKVKAGYSKFILEAPSLIISFVENKEKIQPQFGHLGIQVDSLIEMESRLADVKRADLNFREEMGTNCCFAHQDKYWVQDPDGYNWEVYFFHEDVEFNDPNEANVTPIVEKEKVSLSSLGGSCAPGSGCC